MTKRKCLAIKPKIKYSIFMKDKLLSLVRWSEKYTKTDMVYVLTNTFWMNANTLVVTGGSFLLYLVIGNYLAKEVYGIYQFVLSVGLIINSLTLTGMNIAVNRSVARGYDGILQISVREQLKYSILPFIVGIGISIYYLINNNTLLFFGIILTSIILPITNSLNTWSAFVNGKKDFKTWFLYNQIINILYYGGLIAIILFIPKSIFLILVSLLSNLISNAIAYKKTIEKYEPDETKIDDETLIYGKKT
jgi:O-antigen/teichoic acid export membrane protein